MKRRHTGTTNAARVNIPRTRSTRKQAQKGPHTTAGVWAFWLGAVKGGRLCGEPVVVPDPLSGVHRMDTPAPVLVIG